MARVHHQWTRATLAVGSALTSASVPPTMAGRLTLSVVQKHGDTGMTTALTWGLAIVPLAGLGLKMAYC